MLQTQFTLEPCLNHAIKYGMKEKSCDSISYLLPFLFDLHHHFCNALLPPVHHCFGRNNRFPAEEREIS